MEGDILLIFLPKAVLLFQSTPSAWRETAAGRAAAGNFDISIHSLRMEGDDPAEPEITTKNISIHSLRMEGDYLGECHAAVVAGISIHSLRMEGDDLIRVIRHTGRISIHSLRMEGDHAFCNLI